jgi:hypothetical protein
MFARPGRIVQRIQLTARFAKLENFRPRRLQRALLATRGHSPAAPRLLHVQIAYLVNSVLHPLQHVALHVLRENSAGTQNPCASFVKSDDILLRALRSALNAHTFQVYQQITFQSTTFHATDVFENIIFRLIKSV